MTEKTPVFFGDKSLLVPADKAEALVETAEILADKALMEDIRQSMDEAKRGETVSWEEVKSQLGL
jgi:PHD/YefM family antitoxin component YafN of YafNO toxin-antitoxin module